MTWGLEEEGPLFVIFVIFLGENGFPIILQGL
jgi:hypothetical protein